MARLRVTQVRSSIGTKPKQRGTLRALGLGRIGKTHELADTPEARLLRVVCMLELEDAPCGVPLWFWIIGRPLVDCSIRSLLYHAERGSRLLSVCSMCAVVVRMRGLLLLFALLFVLLI